MTRDTPCTSVVTKNIGAKGPGTGKKMPAELLRTGHVQPKSEVRSTRRKGGGDSNQFERDELSRRRPTKEKGLQIVRRGIGLVDATDSVTGSKRGKSKGKSRRPGKKKTSGSREEGAAAGHVAAAEEKDSRKRTPCGRAKKKGKVSILVWEMRLKVHQKRIPPVQRGKKTGKEEGVIK